MASKVGSRPEEKPEFQEILSLDRTKNPVFIHYAVKNYLRLNPDDDFCALNKMLRNSQSVTHLIPFLPMAESLGRAEFPPGKERKYHLYVYVDSPENRKTLQFYAEQGTSKMRKERLKECGFSSYHLRNDAFEVPYSFVRIFKGCIAQVRQALKDVSVKSLLPEEPLYAEFAQVQALFDQGLLYFPILSADGKLNGVWVVSKEELTARVKKLGPSYSELKEVLDDVISWETAFHHELCFFQFLGGSPLMDLPVQRFVFGFFEDCFHFLKCPSLRKIEFSLPLQDVALRSEDEVAL